MRSCAESRTRIIMRIMRLRSGSTRRSTTKRDRKKVKDSPLLLLENAGFGSGGSGRSTPGLLAQNKVWKRRKCRRHRSQSSIHLPTMVRAGARRDPKEALGSTSEGSSVRAHYQSEGVAGYYSRETYKNPHEGRVREVFQTCWRQHFADHLRTSGTPSFSFLDMCAGSGEVTAAFLQLAEVAGDSRTFACDPYTFRLFEQRFAAAAAAGAGGGKTSSMRAKNKTEVSAAAAAGRSPPTRLCWPLSFGDILQGQLLERMQEHGVDSFDLITCSYALHLAPDEQLPVLAMLLSQLSKWILIITPHKRPVLREDWGWEKMDEIVIARTRGVLYKSTCSSTT